jgi:hypothetical protein
MAGTFGRGSQPTALYASGRESRAVLNALVQGPQGRRCPRYRELITRLESLHLTREELRFAQNYRAGQVLEVIGHRPAGLEPASMM